MNKEILEDVMTGFCALQNQLNDLAIMHLIDYVNANGGVIDTNNKDNMCDTIYAYVYNESEERYEDFPVFKVMVENNSLLINIDWDGYNEEDNWYQVDGGMVLISPTVYSLCECLAQYV